MHQAHAHVGTAAYWQGSFADATAATQRAIELLPPDDPLLDNLERRVKEFDRLLALEKRLPAVLDGKTETSAAELLQMAWMCNQLKKRHLSAVRLYREAFESQPELLGDNSHRFEAARAAALAAAGQGEGTDKLAEAEKAKLRRQAHDWLEADLLMLVQGMKEGRIESLLYASHYLPRWQTDAGLAAIRDPKELARLSEEER
jgi:tetratricopeptide (TPR) repeat protein